MKTFKILACLIIGVLTIGLSGEPDPDVPGPHQNAELIAAWGGAKAARQVLSFSEEHPVIFLKTITQRIIVWDASTPADLFGQLKTDLKAASRFHLIEYSSLLDLETTLLDAGRDDTDPTLMQVRAEILEIGPDITPPTPGNVVAPAVQSGTPFSITFSGYSDTDQGGNQGLKEYRLHFRKDPADDWKRTPHDPIPVGSPQSFEITQMSGAGTYEWLIVAYDIAGNLGPDPDYLTPAQATTVYTP